MVDTHTNKGMLSFTFEGTEYTGFVDGVVTPYGSLSYGLTARLGLELKYSDADKECKGGSIAMPLLYCVLVLRLSNHWRHVHSRQRLTLVVMRTAAKRKRGLGDEEALPDCNPRGMPLA
jgi:hypothetical protein